MILHDSAQILAMKLAAYNKEIGDIREWYKSEHMNYKLIDGERSKWWVWNTTLDFSRESVRQIQTYLDRIADGKLYFFFCCKKKQTDNEILSATYLENYLN